MYLPVLQPMLNIILSKFFKIFVKNSNLIDLTRLQIVRNYEERNQTGSSHSYRVGMLGTVAKDRDSYDPLSVLSTIRGVENVQDSQDLPKDWKISCYGKCSSRSTVNDLLDSFNESSFDTSDSPFTLSMFLSSVK